MKCEAVRDLLEDYALGWLDAETQAAVEAHLDSCPDCRRIALEYAGVMSRLVQAVPQEQPPPALKARLLEKVKADITAQTTRGTTPVIRAPNRDLSRWVRRLRRFESLAAILLITAVVWIARLTVALAQEQQLRSDLLHQTELIFEVVDSEKAERFFLAPSKAFAEQTKPARPPYGKVFVTPDLPYVVAMTGRTPPAPSGQVYNLWLFKGDETILAGAMRVDEKGFSSLVYDSGQPGPRYDSAMIVLQAIGSQTPDGTPVLGWTGE